MIPVYALKAERKLHITYLTIYYSGVDNKNKSKVDWLGVLLLDHCSLVSGFADPGTRFVEFYIRIYGKQVW